MPNQERSNGQEDPSRESKNPDLNRDEVRDFLNKIATTSWNAKETGEDVRDDAQKEHDWTKISAMDRQHGNKFAEMKKDIYNRALSESANPEYTGLLQTALFNRLVEIARESAKGLSKLEKSPSEAKTEEIRGRHSTLAQHILDETRAIIGDQKVDVVLKRFNEVIKSEFGKGTLNIL